MDDGQFFLGQRKRNRFLLGGVQGGVIEGRCACGRGDRVYSLLRNRLSLVVSLSHQKHGSQAQVG